MSPRVSGTSSPRRARALALEEGDVEAAEVLRLEGAHREAEGAHGGVDVGDGDAAADQGLGGGAVALQDAVADEAVADAGLDRDLAQLRGEGEAGGEGLGRGLRGGDDLEELHHVGRAEEVQADEAAAVRQPLGDGAGVEIGGVGREDRVGAAGGAERGEDGALDGEILEDRLDDEVGVGEGGVVGGAR